MKENEKSRILVIDDDEGIRKAIATALSNEGYITDVAGNAKEAIAKSNANFYNLAIIDIRLPDMDGTKLLSAMKETIPEMRKIILTGYPALENAIEAVNKGADAYITKPVNMDELLKTIKDQLRKQEEAREYGEARVAEFVESRLSELRVKELDEQRQATNHKRP